MWSARPLLAGATKSARQKCGPSFPLRACWRSIGKRVSSVVRPASVKRPMSLPSTWAGPKPYATAARVPLAMRRQEAVAAARAQQLLGDDAVEQRRRRRVQVARGLAVGRIVEHLGEPAGQLPGGEEEGPGDVRHGG